MIDLSDSSVSVGFRISGLRAMRSIYYSNFNLVGLIILCKSGICTKKKGNNSRKSLKLIKYLLHLHDGPK